MKRINGKLLLLCILAAALAGLTGCRTLAEEDPNDQQLPWSTPADWEGTIPGMPGRGSGF